MKGSKLTHKFWARAVGLVLFAALFTVLILCIAGVVYCYERGWYDISDIAADTVHGEIMPAQMGEVAAESALYAEESGEQLEKPAPTPMPALQEGAEHAAAEEVMPMSEPTALPEEMVEYEMTAEEDMPAYDASEPSLTGWEQILDMNRYRLIYAGIAAGIAVLALFIFLLCSAAHKEGEEGYVLIRQDNIPFDIYIVLAGLLCIGALTIGLNVTATMWGFMVELAFASLCIAVSAGVAMAACMTFAARIKTKTLFKNTIIYRIFAWLGRLFNMMGMNLKAALIFLGYLLINAIGAAYLFNSRYEGFALVMLAFFNCAVLYGILECVSQMKKLKEAAGALAEGDLSYEMDTSKLKWEFKEHGESLNSVGRGMARAVNERMRSERFKTELITNVSHDLKTPLTSIVTYIDLLQKEEIPGEQAKEYVDTIARQSAKLKKLTEDLIEASKASSGVMSVNLERVNVSELLRQSVAEYGDRMTAAGIATVMTLPEDDIYITADGRLLWRVMDNLLLNICRHGMNGTRAYIGAEKREENTVISFKNISSKELNISPEELLERFVQGDESRSTEGSGLGLSIAQSLTELMKGNMQLYLDGDLFKVELIFPKDEL